MGVLPGHETVKEGIPMWKLHVYKGIMDFVSSGGIFTLVSLLRISLSNE
jgi:hypothetical protein